MEMPAPPERIISLVPSQTELLYDLGLDDEITGITKFCIHPVTWFRSKTRVGGTKTLNLERIASLQPDLIIANKEENTKEQIEFLSEKFRVWVSDVNTLEQAFDMVLQVGILTGKEAAATTLNAKIAFAFNELGKNISRHPPVRAAYLIWKDPYMAAANDTFISDMMFRCGLINVFNDRVRYPEVSIQEISDSGCEVLLLSSEPYPFREKHLEEFKQLLPGLNIKQVNGEMFSWYGSRLLKTANYFRKLNAELVGLHIPAFLFSFLHFCIFIL